MHRDVHGDGISMGATTRRWVWPASRHPFRALRERCGISDVKTRSRFPCGGGRTSQLMTSIGCSESSAPLVSMRRNSCETLRTIQENTGSVLLRPSAFGQLEDSLTATVLPYCRVFAAASFQEWAVVSFGQIQYCTTAPYYL